jgi:autotransporter-associated beta strand protein
MMRKSNGGLALAIAAGTAGLISFTGSSARADLLLYEPFDYTVGAALGGSGTSPIGQTNTTYNATWYGRQTGTSYNATTDSSILSGSLAYTGLAASGGNSVSLGRTTAQTALNSDSIQLPGGPISSGAVYYSMLMKLNDMSGLATSPNRWPIASLGQEPSTAAEAGSTPAFYSSVAGKVMPAGFWIRRNPTTTTLYQLGAGKQQGDGIGPSNGAAAWQANTGATANQTGNTSGADQFVSQASDTYFVVIKYQFDAIVPAQNNQSDTVSIYVNPIASTLGSNAGEATAGASGGSYYAATNTYAGTTAVDAAQIQSFFLNQHSVAAAGTNSLVTVDELRIGTSWADVTPAAAPVAQTYYWDVNGTIGGAGGGSTPHGDWDGVENNFNTNSAGGSGTFAWDPTPADTVVFSAGGGATGNFIVSISGTRTAAGIVVEEGSVTLGGGTLATPSFDVAADSSAIVLSTLNGGAANSITKTGVGALVLASANTYTGGTTVNGGSLLVGNADALNGGSLIINTTASAQLTGDLPKAVTVSTLTTAGSGQLDVTDNSMVIKGMTVAQVQAEIVKGFNAGQWNGVGGLTSSTAATALPAITAIGFASNGVLNKSEFRGVSGLDADDVLVKYTYYGDSDLNGATTLDDYTLFLNGYQTAGTTWVQGDYDYNGQVTLDDFTLFLAGYQQQGGPLSELESLINSTPMGSADRAAMLAAVQAVPEPAGLALLGTAGVGLLARRRRVK